MNTAVELPTARQSRHFNQRANIHDPDWIPVLDSKASPTSQTSPPRFDTGPRFPKDDTRPSGTGQDGIAASKSASRAYAQELDAGPIVTSRSRQRSLEPHHRQRSRETEDTLTSSGDDTVLSADAPSTAGTGSLLENQTYTVPRSALKESKSFTQVSAAMSDRSSTGSNNKRPAVPTSRYNRKPGLTGGSGASTPVSNSPTVFAQALADSPRVPPLDSLQPRKMSTPSLHELSLLQAKPTSPISLYSSTHAPDTIKVPHVASGAQSPPLPRPAVQELPAESVGIVHVRSRGPVELPTTALPQLPPEPPSYELSTSKNRKSTASIRTTASVRKKRALHSHPSNHSLRSAKQESKPETPTTEVQSTSGSLRRSRTNESRRSVITDSTPPSVAPAGPLPELPPRIASKRPSARHRSRSQKSADGHLSLFPQQASLAQPPPVAKPESESTPVRPTLYYSPSSFSLAASAQGSQDHQSQHRHNRSEANPIPHRELADFMTSKSTLIFRRFDEMHVKLLLSIQDEISALEQELLALEATAQKTSDESEDEYEDDDYYDEDERYNKGSLDEKGMAARRKSTKRDRPKSSRGIKESTEPTAMKREKRKIKIMADLRRLLAEYDHLYSNWTLMQKSPATLRDRRDLERYLADDIETSETARSDMLWAETNAGDLSRVAVGHNADTDSIASKSKSSSWGRKKGKGSAKRLDLGMRSASSTTVLASGMRNGISTFAPEKDTPGPMKVSLFASWFGVCAGRRK